MARRRTTDPFALWRTIEQAGGVQRYVEQQLQEHGYLVERRDTDGMSKRELEAYKKQLKGEAEEKRRLKKDAWRAYRANHIVHLGEGVFWNDEHDWDKWDLENAEERAAENELPPLDKPQQLAEALGLTVAELRWLTYHRDLASRIHYRRFTIPKSSGGDREIWAPHSRLKAAQRWILRNIAERLLVHGSAHGFLPGRSILTNAAKHTNSQLLLQMDVKDFFPTVTLPRVKGVFRKAGYREQIATLLSLLCTEAPRQIVERDGKSYFVSLGPRCLPQGAPTSPALTNVVCLKLDRRLAGVAAKFGWRYTRYADDMTFSLPAGSNGAEHLTALIGLTKKIVGDEGFTLHPDKTRVSRPGGRQAVTGLVVNGEGRPRVPRPTRRRLRAMLHNLQQGKPLRDGDTLETLHGYGAFLLPTHPEQAAALLKQ